MRRGFVNHGGKPISAGAHRSVSLNAAAALCAFRVAWASVGGHTAMNGERTPGIADKVVRTMEGSRKFQEVYGRTGSSQFTIRPRRVPVEIQLARTPPRKKTIHSARSRRGHYGRCVFSFSCTDDVSSAVSLYEKKKFLDAMSTKCGCECIARAFQDLSEPIDSAHDLVSREAPSPTRFSAFRQFSAFACRSPPSPSKSAPADVAVLSTSLATIGESVL